MVIHICVQIYRETTWSDRPTNEDCTGAMIQTSNCIQYIRMYILSMYIYVYIYICILKVLYYYYIISYLNLYNINVKKYLLNGRFLKKVIFTYLRCSKILNQSKTARDKLKTKQKQ